ncbi:hypothetical protein GY45DRAFT_1264394 [Cubamyces sp. BRFM 1775]|nr:hypothetical protein GY45DRAFT_1264394 [Cubamyces sp. BRFM 1775]
MIAVDDALAIVHEKENAIRIACFEFDQALKEMQQDLGLPTSEDGWVPSFASRITFLNKEYRRRMKNDIQALSTRLRQTYGQSGIGAMPALLDQINAAATCQAEAERMMIQLESVYNAGVREKTFSVEDRVLLRRVMPRLQHELRECKEDGTKLQSIVNQWGTYFHVLSSEQQLSQVLETFHLGKLTKGVVEEKATPIFARIFAMRRERNDMIFQSSRLGLEHETAWLAHGNRGVRERELRRAVRQYEDIIARARAQHAAQTDVLSQAEEVALLASTPQSVEGPDGAIVFLDQFREAYQQFKIASTTCTSMHNVGRSCFWAATP